MGEMNRQYEKAKKGAGKGYGEKQGGMGRGVFSVKSAMSPAPVPKKVSEENLSSPVQRKDAAKVRMYAKEQSRREDLRGMAS
jgi:hypothetical protein